jgi:hypothetical protein
MHYKQVLPMLFSFISFFFNRSMSNATLAIITFMLYSGVGIGAMPSLDQQLLSICNNYIRGDSEDIVLKAVNQLLVQSASVNAQDALGFTPLHYAIQCNFSKVINILLDGGASPNIPEKRLGRTAFHFAVNHGRKEVVETLLKKKVIEFHSTNRMGQTPFISALIEEQHKEIALMLLAQPGFNVTKEQIDISLIKALYPADAADIISKLRAKGLQIPNTPRESQVTLRLHTQEKSVADALPTPTIEPQDFIQQPICLSQPTVIISQHKRHRWSYAILGSVALGAFSYVLHQWYCLLQQKNGVPKVTEKDDDDIAWLYDEENPIVQQQGV